MGCALALELQLGAGRLGRQNPGTCHLAPCVKRTAADVAHVHSSCRAACLVKSLEAWRAAVRHTGRAFGLQPAVQEVEGGTGEQEGGATGSGASPLQQLPYPQLETTASTAQFAPAATLSEYYDEPGGEGQATAGLGGGGGPGGQVGVG